MKQKINKEHTEVSIFRNNDLYLGSFVKVEISATMYAWEFDQFSEITLSVNDLEELFEVGKKLK